MNQYLSSASLKSMAKGQLLGKYRAVIPAFLLHALCIGAVNMAATSLFPGSTLPAVLFNSILTYIVTLFLSIFSVGEAFIYLKITCNQMPVISDLFWGFRNDTARILKVQAIRTAFSTVLLLPANLISVSMDAFFTTETVIALSRGDSAGNAPMFLVYIFLLIAGVGGSIFLELVFSQSLYLLLDFPEYTAKQVLVNAMRLMKKNKGRLFYLELSFIPLFLLALLSCGIGLLWLMPYYYTSLADFYLDLIKKSTSANPF